MWNLVGEATIETIQVNTVSQTPIFLLNQLFAMTDSHTFSFCDVLSRLLISLYIFLLLLKLVLLKLVFLVLQQMTRASGR